MCQSHILGFIFIIIYKLFEQSEYLCGQWTALYYGKNQDYVKYTSSDLSMSLLFVRLTVLRDSVFYIARADKPDKWDSISYGPV